MYSSNGNGRFVASIQANGKPEKNLMVDPVRDEAGMRAWLRRQLGRTVCSVGGYILDLPGVQDMLTQRLPEVLASQFLANPIGTGKLMEQIAWQLEQAGFCLHGGIEGEVSLREGIANSRYEVGPFPTQYVTGDSPYGPTSLLLSLGLHFTLFKPGGIVDGLQPNFRRELLLNPDYTEHVTARPGEVIAVLPKGLTSDQYAALERQVWAKYGDRLITCVRGCLNAETFQSVRFFLPTNGETAYAGWLTGVTRYARFHIQVEKAPRLHTGDQHRITLEISNDGPFIFILTAGWQPIAQLTVVPVKGAPSTSASFVQGQKGPHGRNDLDWEDPYPLWQFEERTGLILPRAAAA